jgi:hypothetical protein
LSHKLGELKDGFYYLTGMLDDYTGELILTAHGNIGNLVFVEELVGSAPEIHGCKFIVQKPEMDIKSTSNRMDKYLSDSDTLWFYFNDNPQYPDEIDITIVHKDFNESDNSSINCRLNESHFLETLRRASRVRSEIAGDLSSGYSLISK